MVERRADAHAIDLMAKAGGDPHALGALLVRIEGTNHPGPKLLLDHPDTQDRLAAINAAPAIKTKPLLSPSEWAALKRICVGP
jgi:predicted Zn-dependent protease